MGRHKQDNKWTADRVSKLLYRDYITDVLSCDMPIKENEKGEETTILDMLVSEDTSPEEIAIRNCEKEQLIELVEMLKSPRQIKVIKMRFGLDNDIPMSLSDVGECFGLSRERIRQIENKALINLRKICESKGLNRKDFNI